MLINELLEFTFKTEKEMSYIYLNMTVQQSVIMK
jgi:hypothetical protein